MIKYIIIILISMLLTTAATLSTDLPWHVIATGGGELVDQDSLTIDATIGQAIVGKLTSAQNTVEIGFWTGYAGAGCDYMPGDMNHDGRVLGSDVTYGVRYLKGLGLPPPDSCFNFNIDKYFYSAADVNGDCEFRGSDITRLVNYFKAMPCCPCLKWCPWTPPIHDYPQMCPR
jgi:hypothetical protein